MATTTRPPRPSTAARARRIARAAPFPLWAAFCFFASGAAGLLYEIVWSKQIAYLLGASLHSVATVVAAFLGGLAIGARVLGVPLARRGEGPRTYAKLELGVAVLGLALLPVLRGIDPLVGAMYRGLGGETAAFAVARFVVLFVLLLPPAAMMGATLPVLVAHFERERVGATLARLYALNTFGAVAGSVLGGFALLPNLGLLGTTIVAAALNVLVAFVSWRIPGAPAPGEALPSSEGAAAQRAAAAPETLSGGKPAPVYLAFTILFALSGFAALVFQIAWVRLFSLVFGSSVYSFSAVLGMYLLGLAIGAALVSRWMALGVSLAHFARVQLALAVTAAVVLFAFPRLPEWAFALGESSGPRWGALMTGQLGIAAVVLLVPCALLGAAFPIATRVLQRSDGGHAAGFAYAVNTLGTIAGSLVAGFVAIPMLGVQGTHLLALGLSLTIGLATLALARAAGEGGRSDLGWALGGLVIAGGLVALAPPWDVPLMSAGAYRPVQAETHRSIAQMAGGAGPTLWRATRYDRVLYYEEGLNASIVVGSSDVGRARWLRVGGKVDASSGDSDTQIMVGLIPAALADSGARALVVGLGSGMTASAALAAGAGKTDIVELEQRIVEASHFFYGPGEHPADDPRANLIVGDARTLLLHGDEKYGLIVSQPSNPWISGMNHLFTTDFYRRVKARLEPDGVFCSWIQLYELSPQTFGSMIRSFVEVFPEGDVFVLWRAVDILLIAAPQERKLDLERLRSPAVRELLTRTTIESPEAVAAFYGGSLAEAGRLAPPAPLNTDDRPFVEYRAGRDLVEIGRLTSGGHPEVVSRVPFAAAPPAGPRFADWSRDEWYRARILQLLREGDEARAGFAAQAGAAAGVAGLDPVLAEGRRRMVGRARVDQARQLLVAERNAEGLAALEQAVVEDPENAMAWVLVAHERLRADRVAGADSALRRAQHSTDREVRAEAATVTAQLENRRTGPQAAIPHLLEAQELQPRVNRHYLLEAQARESAGDLAGARDAVRRGLLQLPKDPRLSAAAARLDGGVPATP